jgi:cytochrome c oxidase subunit 2
VNPRRILTSVVVAIVLVGLGILVAYTVDLMPGEASVQAQLVDRLFRLLLGIATVIFVGVEGALVYAVVRFRRRAGDEADGPAIHGSTTLEAIWMAIPAVIVVVIAFVSFRVLVASAVREAGPLEVEVVGRQFTWEFRYPDADVSSTELHLPVGRQVHFVLTSDDVIHSLWIPEFRIKQDATPGRTAEMVITPTRLGRFPIRCAELCGAAHSAMTTEAVVESPEEFAAWLEGQQSSGAPESPDDLGRRLFTQYGCNACHTLSDAGAAGVVGPSLDGIGAAAASIVPGMDARAYLEQSILDPGAYVVEGFPSGVMPPDFGERLSDEELNALVEYLLSH